MRVAEACVPQYFQHEVGLAEDVTIDMVRELRREPLLQLAIAACDVRVRAEVIPDRELIENADRPLGADVEMVPRQAGRVLERLAIFDVEVAQVMVPKRGETIDTGTTSALCRTTIVMSMIGLAFSPGTDVLPTCSMRSATPDTAGQTRERRTSKRRGHSGSYSTTMTVGSALCMPVTLILPWLGIDHQEKDEFGAAVRVAIECATVSHAAASLSAAMFDLTQLKSR